MGLTPTRLEGRHVRLEPLSQDHCDGLSAATRDGNLWELKVTTVPTPDAMSAWISTTQALGGDYLTYAVVHRDLNRAIGVTGFLRYSEKYRRIEIGGTWLADSWQRTPVNGEMKLLMLQHAFETLGCLRVQLITDMLNAPSRTAIERLGARFEGCMRNERVMPDGRVRDTALYSIIASDWSPVKAALRKRLERPFARTLPQ